MNNIFEVLEVGEIDFSLDDNGKYKQEYRNKFVISKDKKTFLYVDKEGNHVDPIPFIIAKLNELISTINQLPNFVSKETSDKKTKDNNTFSKTEKLLFALNKTKEFEIDDFIKLMKQI